METAGNTFVRQSRATVLRPEVRHNGLTSGLCGAGFPYRQFAMAMPPLARASGGAMITS